MVNNNLEQQISDIFKKMFGFNIDNLVESKFKLGDLIESIDNRGKTPPLSDKPTSYPIIDVKALSSNMRIVDYNKCSKYVDEETYNTWFRSGHPKQYDILFSTVGSLAEMKLFLGNVGCIAQNVVGFRSRGISSLYLYQYLKY
ncbi:restriction endonuclease subunit S, partial [Enterococcus cecorum]|nr:restriction endonuclease subunit S [Enterococcus cecorum]